MSVVKLTDPITFFTASGLNYEPVSVCDIKTYDDELVNYLAGGTNVFITNLDTCIEKEANTECKELISKVNEINPDTKFYIETERS